MRFIAMGNTNVDGKKELNDTYGDLSVQALINKAYHALWMDVIIGPCHNAFSYN